VRLVLPDEVAVAELPLIAVADRERGEHGDDEGECEPEGSSDSQHR
jgi:hypothetical protein